jgi:hypothetical protein
LELKTQDMKPSPAKVPSTQIEGGGQDASGDDWRLNALIDRLPERLRSTVRALRRRSARWLRIPAGLLLIAGGILSFLPLLGVWMLPLGLALLAEDVPLLRNWRTRILNWVERRHPAWLEKPPQ